MFGTNETVFTSIGGYLGIVDSQIIGIGLVQ